MAAISTLVALKRVNSVTFFSGQRMDQGYQSYLAVKSVHICVHTLLLKETLIPVCSCK